MVTLPPEFIQTVQSCFGENGRSWLAAFPALLAEAAHRWDLTDIRPVPKLSYNFVAMALSGASVNKRSRSVPPSTGPSILRQAQDSAVPPILRLRATPLRTRGSAQGRVILKIGVPNRELTSEIAALKHYAGRGACRLLDADVEKGMLLLERLQPGRMLAAVEDDDRATKIAAGVMKALWESSNWKCSNDFAKHPVRDIRYGTTKVVTTDFIQLKDWFAGFQRLRQRFDGGTGPMPKDLVEAAESLSIGLLSENKDESLLHGDFHHFNVIESSRGWLAIDPKGVIGPQGYELGPFLINPVERFLSEGNPGVRTERRIAILSDMLGMERERIRAWGLCHAVLSAWWNIEDNDPSRGEYSLRCADVFRQLRV